MISVKDYLDAYMDSVRLVPQDPYSREVVRCYNRDLLERYPWLTPYNVCTGEPIEDYNYEDTWADDIPYGWRLAFGDRMIEELDQLLKKYNIADYKIYQIKEKWGALRWYDNGFLEEGYEEYSNWLRKYESLSECTCIFCGKPATHLTKGWIMPICKSCAGRKGYTESRLDPVTFSTESTGNQESI